MKNERICGDHTANENDIFCGRVEGNLTVKSGVKLINLGRVFGDVKIEDGATLENRGRIHGDIYGHGFADVFGIVEGKVLTDHYCIHKDSIVDGTKYEQDEKR